MKTLVVLASLVFCLTFPASAQSASLDHLYPIEASHSYVQFEATYMGYAKVRGNFRSFKGSIYYDPQSPDKTSISFQIDVESINTNNDWRDRDLKSGNWFQTEQYPYIRFVSRKVQPKGDEFQVVGDLTIKETTMEIQFLMPRPLGVIKDIRGDHQVIFTGSYALNRKEYGVMGKNWSQVKEGIAALSDEVTIEFSLLGKQMKADNFSNFLRNPQRPSGAIYASYQEGGLEAALQRYEELGQDTSVQLNAHALNSVGYILLLQKSYEDAETIMSRNLQDFTDDPNVHDSFGELHAKMGNMQEAIKHYHKALEMDETNMNAKEALRLLRAAGK